jgi:hypothetical protein
MPKMMQVRHMRMQRKIFSAASYLEAIRCVNKNERECKSSAKSNFESKPP